VTEAIAQLEAILASVPQRLATIPEVAAEAKPDPARWSRKEILGHLIDSAGNNQQRFVRAQLSPRLEFPSYQQESWVSTQAYATESWGDLVNLWVMLNRHLLHVVKAMPESVLAHECVIGGGAPMPLRELVTGYVGHVDNHLRQIL
jgi:hypothetical protein